MSDQLFTLDDLAKLRAREEEERNKLTYETYLRKFQSLIVEGNPKVLSTISDPESNDRDEYVCIREPYEFMHLFQGCSGQDECIELFRSFVDARDNRVVDQVIPAREHDRGLWFNTTKNGINLRPGLKDEEWSSPMPVVLGDDTVHALVVGRTGSGKSVFLNSIIFSLLAEYAPWEIDLYLADFKKVELSRYLSKYEVPHIKSVAATSEIRYVVSLLAYLVKTMRARQDFFALVGLQKISEVRDRYSIVLPRVLLLVDEFQQLFVESTTREQSVIEDLLTSITKLGRATGFHLMFASQEMSGTMSSSVFANFKARFALACDADVSARVLGNAAASKIDKKGIVLANTGGTSEENNQLFKVPYISDEYFYQYLGWITEEAKFCHFGSVHKFYQEDSIKDISELENVLDAIRETRKAYLQSNSNLFDIITLGEAVVFNYKKYDYETFFLERGVRKNIGVFSPLVDDTAYICKLLTANFGKSPNADRYRHLILVRNDLFMKKYDLKKDLGVSTGDLYYTNDFWTEITDLFNKRKDEATLLNSFHQYSSLNCFAYDALCTRTKVIGDFTVAKEEEFFEAWKEISLYFENKSIEDIPDVENAILEDYEFDRSYFRILDMLYEKVTKGKTVVELFEPTIIWIIGAEMIGRFPKDMEEVLTDSTNYNMLFVVVASNNDFNDFHILCKTCDYIFVSGNNETYYTKLKIPFTKKAENSIAVDFAIASSATQRSFKKFKYDLQEVMVPEIDFDRILR